MNTLGGTNLVVEHVPSYDAFSTKNLKLSLKQLWVDHNLIELLNFNFQFCVSFCLVLLSLFITPRRTLLLEHDYWPRETTCLVAFGGGGSKLHCLTSLVFSFIFHCLKFKWKERPHNWKFFIWLASWHQRLWFSWTNLFLFSIQMFWAKHLKRIYAFC